MSKLLEKLQTRKSDVVARMNELNESVVGENDVVRDFTEEEEKEYSSLEAELKRVNTQIARQAAADDAEREIADATRARASEPKDTTGRFVKLADNARFEQKDLRVTQKIALLAWSQYKAAVARNSGLQSVDAFSIMADAGFQQLSDMFKEATVKALNTGSTAAGGALIPSVLAEEFIPFLYPRSVMIANNPTMIDLSAGNLTIAGGNASASASYRTEASDIAHTQATFKEITLAAKHLACITSVTRELLNQSPFAVESIVTGDLVEAWLQTMDTAFLRSDGTGNTPSGIYTQIASGNKIDAATGTNPSVDTIDQELSKVMLKVVESLVPSLRPVWLMAPRVAMFLEAKRDGNGNKAFPEMSGKSKALKGYPVDVTTKIPTTLGGGTNESEIYFNDFGHTLFGDTKQLELLVSSDASFVQSGVLVSAFSRNLVAMRLTGSHDLKLRHDTSGAMLNKVQWGA